MGLWLQVLPAGFSLFSAIIACGMNVSCISRGGGAGVNYLAGVLL